MCKILNISRSGYYSYEEPSTKEDIYSEIVEKTFNENYQAYGTRRIQAELRSQGINLSRRRIARIMHSKGLVSAYTVKNYKPESSGVNQSEIKNIVDREFDEKEKFEIIVSDLTYVRVGLNWHYICTIVDLHNREIIGYSSGPSKDAKLVKTAFPNIQSNLFNFKCFHTDRGKEFDNQLIDDVLNLFGIKRSLSKPGSPYDNAVAEATFKSMKTEFIRNRIFSSQHELDKKLSAYVWWFNNKRLHSSLNYQSPTQWNQMTL